MSKFYKDSSLKFYRFHVKILLVIRQPKMEPVKRYVVMASTTVPMSEMMVTGTMEMDVTRTVRLRKASLVNNIPSPTLSAMKYLVQHVS